MRRGRLPRLPGHAVRIPGKPADAEGREPLDHGRVAEDADARDKDVANASDICVLGRSWKRHARPCRQMPPPNGGRFPLSLSHSLETCWHAPCTRACAQRRHEPVVEWPTSNAKSALGKVPTTNTSGVLDVWPGIGAMWYRYGWPAETADSSGGATNPPTYTDLSSKPPRNN